MANTYAWNINALDTLISHDSNSNVIHTIHWTLKVTDDNSNTAETIGTHSVEYDADNFTEYNDLTEADIISWLEASETGLDVAAIKANLDARVEEIATPTQRTFYLPFVVESSDE